jgi:hypothetical protein
MMIRIFAAALSLSLLALGSAPALALPVTLTIFDGSAGKMQFSFLHEASSNQANIDGNQFFKGGAKTSVAAVLTGDLTAEVLTIDAGVIDVDDLSGLPDIVVTGGSIDFSGPGNTDTFIGTLVTANYGTFYFFDNQDTGSTGLAPFAQTFDGTTAILWGNNWGPGLAPDEVTCDEQSDVDCEPFTRWGIDLGILVEGTMIPGPEASTTSLLLPALAGLFVFGNRRRA